jgi:hypothetical protein
MVQSKNVVRAHILHIEWNADSFVFCFVKSKGDQTGHNINQEWHVYANPHNPKICLVLALACYVFFNPGIFSAAADNEVVEGGEQAFGRDAYSLEETSTTNSWTACTIFLAKYSKEFFVLGNLPGNLGLHLARKGASNHTCSGSTVLPPMVSICLCAMWSMGHVKEHYLQYEKAGNQYLGRVVCGLDVNSVKFAVLPPFFEFDCTGQGDTGQGDTGQGGADDGTSARVYSLLRDYMVRGESVPASVHCMFYFCFALLCYHFDFLKQVLHKKNKLQASHFFICIPIEIKAAATVKDSWNRMDATPTHTGLSPHITFRQILSN